MKNMYSFNFNAGGFKIAINVISDSLEAAVQKAYSRCAEHVGDNFKRKALQGDYLVSVNVTHEILE